ncbi:MAG: prohead protease/major capsid protein fusion protein [Pseudomonadota bacterium]
MDQLTFGLRDSAAPLLLRALMTRAEVIDAEERTLRISCSSEYPVHRRSYWDGEWVEVLDHSDEAIDMERFESGAPVLMQHDSWNADSHIGVVERAWIEDRQLMAEIRLSKRESISEFFEDIVAGIRCSVSVGYLIQERVLERETDDGPDEYRVSRWSPHEVSFVSIPADPTVGMRSTDIPRAGDMPERALPELLINHEKSKPPEGFQYEVRTVNPAAPAATKEERTMSRKNGQPAAQDPAKKREADPATDPAPTTVSTDPAPDANRGAEVNDRIQEYYDIFDTLPESVRAENYDIVKRWVHDEVDPKVASREALKLMAERSGAPSDPHVQTGEDEGDKFQRSAELSLLARNAFTRTPELTKENESNPIRHYTLRELARAYVERAGVKEVLDPMAMVGRAFTLRSAIGHSTSDFANLLQNIINKTVLRGYTEAAETWRTIARVGSLSDFKTGTRVGLNDFDDLDRVSQGGEYKYGTIGDRGEQIRLGTYGKLLAVTRETIINDDLGELAQLASKMGRAAARVPGDLVYAVLTTNPVMSDGIALFDAQHNNLAGATAGITVSSLTAARVAMALQTDGSNNANGLNIPMSRLVVPVALQTTALQLREAEYDPANTNNVRTPNPYRNSFEVTADPRLDSASSTGWYAVADPNQFDTIECAFLNGNETPYLEEKMGWNIDGAEMKVRLDVGVAALDFRTMYRFPSA